MSIWRATYRTLLLTCQHPPRVTEGRKRRLSCKFHAKEKFPAQVRQEMVGMLSNFNGGSPPERQAHHQWRRQSAWKKP
eukprot:5633331-Prorocentrum_lima.AAC.1